MTDRIPVVMIEGGFGGTVTVKRDTLAAPFTTTAVSTWTPVTGLSFTITPSTSGVLNMLSRIRLRSSGAVNNYARAKISPAPVTGDVYLSDSREESAVDKRQTYALVGGWELAAGVAYTVTVEVYQGAAGTLTVDSTTEDTELLGVFIAAGSGSGTPAAADVTYAGAPNLAATNVEAALDELDAEKAAVGALGITGAGCSAWRSTAQTIPTNTDTVISLDSEAFDTNSFHDPATPTRLTVPAGFGGKYLAVGHVRYVTNTTGVRVAWIRKNGTTYLSNTPIATSTSGVAVLTDSIIELVAGDYVELGTYQNSGGNLDTGVSGTSLWTYLSLARVGD